MENLFKEDPDVDVGSTRGRVPSSKRIHTLDTEDDHLRRIEERKIELTYGSVKPSPYNMTDSDWTVHTEYSNSKLELMLETHGH